MTKSSVRISPPLEGRGWGGVFDWLIIRFGQKRLRSCGGKENAPLVHMLLTEVSHLEGRRPGQTIGRGETPANKWFIQ